jgi:hypothetical protein
MEPTPATQTASMDFPLIQSVDHIMVRASAAEPLYDFFSSTLGLPVAWPLQHSEFATFGWVTVGNTNLEFWAARNNSDLPSATELPLFHGFALGPANLLNSISTLAERGIACKSPRPFVTKRLDGEDVVNFTNSVVLDVSSESCCVFFCDWCADGTIYPWHEKLTASERQQREQAQLLACSGGRLGITGLIEIQIETPKDGASRSAWQAIAQQQGEIIRLTDSVRLRFVHGPQYKIAALVLGVRSFNKARDYLAQESLLESECASELTLLKEATGGLTFRIREAD